MSESNYKIYFVRALLAFISLPLLLWSLGDFAERSVLKESISVLILLAFSLMLGQFFLTRSNGLLTKGLKRSQAIKIHKYIGYLFIVVLLVHPFLIVFPRYFESGITPEEAFVTLITSLTSTGVIIGMVAWSLMLILVITAFFRKQLPMKVKTWRIVHGILSMLFITLASWHATDMGRHTNLALSVYIIILATVGVFLLLKLYILAQINWISTLKNYSLPKKTQKIIYKVLKSPVKEGDQ